MDLIFLMTEVSPVVHTTWRRMGRWRYMYACSWWRRSAWCLRPEEECVSDHCTEMWLGPRAGLVLCRVRGSLSWSRSLLHRPTRGPVAVPTAASRPKRVLRHCSTAVETKTTLGIRSQNYFRHFGGRKKALKGIFELCWSNYHVQCKYQVHVVP